MFCKGSNQRQRSWVHSSMHREFLWGWLWVKFRVTQRCQYQLLLAPGRGCFSYNRHDCSFWAITVSSTVFQGILAIIGNNGGEFSSDRDGLNRALLTCHSHLFCVSFKPSVRVEFWDDAIAPSLLLLLQACPLYFGLCPMSLTPSVGDQRTDVLRKPFAPRMVF